MWAYIPNYVPDWYFVWRTSLPDIINVPKQTCRGIITYPKENLEEQPCNSPSLSPPPLHPHPPHYYHNHHHHHHHLSTVRSTAISYTSNSTVQQGGTGQDGNSHLVDWTFSVAAIEKKMENHHHLMALFRCVAGLSSCGSVPERGVSRAMQAEKRV